MSIKNDAIILAVAAVVLVGVAYYVKKKVGDAVDAVADPLTAMWADSARFASESWGASAPVLDTAIEHITGAPSIYVPGMSYPEYLGAANDRRDAIAGQYGPQIVGGKLQASNPINDGFTSLYQSFMGQGRTLGSDLYDWTH